MIASYVVVGTASSVDKSVVVGPYRKLARAEAAWDELTRKGYAAEIHDLTAVEDVPSALDDEE